MTRNAAAAASRPRKKNGRGPQSAAGAIPRRVPGSRATNPQAAPLAAIAPHGVLADMRRAPRRHPRCRPGPAAQVSRPGRKTLRRDERAPAANALIVSVGIDGAFAAAITREGEAQLIETLVQGMLFGHDQVPAR